MRSLNIPLSDDTIRSLKVGDPVSLNGIMITGRDAAHKWMVDTFIKQTRQPQGDDLEVYEAIKKLAGWWCDLSLWSGRLGVGHASNTSLWLPDPPPASVKSPTRAW